MSEDGRQRSEDGGQRTEDREQMSEDRCQRTEDRGQRTEDREQMSENRCQRTDIGMWPPASLSYMLSELEAAPVGMRKNTKEKGRGQRA